jgi:hypothetical protein
VTVDDGAVDERLAALDDRVASAADAWLTDPRDVGVYARLVTAIEARRAYLRPQLPTDDEPAAEPPVAVPAATQEDEVLDGLADTSAAAPLGELLAGDDPREVLDRLRR